MSYTSHGALLVIGPAEAASAAAARLADLPERVVLASDGAAAADAPVHRGRVAALTGHLGAFLAQVETPEGLRNAAELLGPERTHFDLVLDLGEPPLLADRLPPAGYFAPQGDPAELEQALEELPGMVGEFEKPTYFHYDPTLCAHGRSGITACTRCLDTCPAGAITSLAERIEVDPLLCQGAGSCASVCPSGAIRYGYPALGDTLDGLRTLLQGYRTAGGAVPRLLVHDGEAGQAWLEAHGAELPESLLPVAVEEVGSLGLDSWLGALAYGAADVAVLLPPTTPTSVRSALEAQVGVAEALLTGLGYGPGRVRLLSPEALAAALAGPAPEPVAVAATYAGANEKRAMIFWALDHLHDHAPAPRPMLDLPAGAPFGTAQVDDRTCTLCLSCVSICPGHALQDGYDQPQVNFIEGNCLQCGLCTRVCPENAIWISPRMLFNPEARSRPRVLYEEPPFHCISCGKPFATRRMIERMTEKLRGHRLYQDGAGLARLQMCEDCRVRSLMEDDESLVAPPR